MTDELRPGLAAPDMQNALSFAGILCHFVASDREIGERLARFMEHCPGDLDAAIIAAYAARAHDLLSPDCKYPATAGREAMTARRPPGPGTDQPSPTGPGGPDASMPDGPRP